MNRIALILSFGMLLVQTAFAQTVWTLKTVPNTRLESNYIHVSDPDGYLSDSTEAVINDALCSIREQADVFVVTLCTIGDDEPKQFANGLFNYWGIGDAETDNGVLLLFVEDQHALEFETGYGAENTLTDARCSMIFNNTIVPYFKAGDYEGGLCAGVADLVEVFGGAVPDGLMSNLANRGGYDDEDLEEKEDVMSGFGAFFLLCFLLPIPFISFFRWLTGLTKRKKTEVEPSMSLEVRKKDDISYFDTPILNKMETSVWKKKGFLRFLVYGVLLVVFYLFAIAVLSIAIPSADSVTQNDWATGLTLFAYLSLTCVVQNVMELRKADALAKASDLPKAIYVQAKKDPHSLMMRIVAPWCGLLLSRAFKKRIKNSSYCCPTCGLPMEPDALRTLPRQWALEQEIKAYRFVSYRCPSRHSFVEREHGANYNNYINCVKCGAHASKLTQERTLRKADYKNDGEKLVTYTCQCCGQQFEKTKRIPKLVYSSSSSSSSRSYGSSHSSGGSFGGGHSGGGGYSGRW